MLYFACILLVTVARTSKLCQKEKKNKKRKHEFWSFRRTANRQLILPPPQTFEFFGPQGCFQFMEVPKQQGLSLKAERLLFKDFNGL